MLSQGPLPTRRAGTADVPVHGRTGLRPARAAAARRSSSSPTWARRTTPCRPTWSRCVRSSTPASQGYYSVPELGGRFPIYAPPAGFVTRMPTCISGGRPAVPPQRTYMATAGGSACSGSRPCRRRARPWSLQHLDQAIAFFNDEYGRPRRGRHAQPGRARVVRRGHLAAVHDRAVQHDRLRDSLTGAWLFSFASQLNIARLTRPPHPNSLNLKQLRRGARRVQRESRPQRADLAELDRRPAARSGAGRYRKPHDRADGRVLGIWRRHVSRHIQDNSRAPLFGMRTMGAGGSVVGYRGPPSPRASAGSRCR